MNPTQKGRVLLVGWDAADWKVIHPLIAAGKMPHLQRLMARGASGQIATLHPPLSPMLWTSIATGKRPFKHGIHGFTEPTPDGRAVQPVTNLSRTCKALWNIANQSGLRSIVVGWWPSHPAEPINGVTVSDHYHRAHGPLDKGWPLLAGAVHPPELAKTLAELRMHPEELATPMMTAFIARAGEIDQNKDRRLLALAKTLCECVSIHSAATWLLDHEAWDFCGVYYDAIDHFSHGFMRYHPPKQAWISDADFEMFRDVVSVAYQFHDQMLGTLLAKAGKDVRVIVMSDHGFHPDHLRPKAIPAIPAGPAIEHREYGILVMAGPGIKENSQIRGASVLDITPTILTMYGLPVGADMDGKVLVDAWAEPPAVQVIASWEDVPGADGRHPPNARLDPQAAREALQQLVALGYIEKPDDDADRAVANAVRERRYNLCEAYQDAHRHSEALEIARELYEQDRDEQRFAVKLFVSCQALGEVEEMRRIVADLDGRRRQLFVEALQQVKRMRALAKQRFAERKAAAGQTPAPEEIEQAVDEAVEGPPPPEVSPDAAREAPAGQKGEAGKREPLLTREERKEAEHWRKLARFQPAVVDYLKAQVFTADRQWAAALASLQRVKEAHLVRPGLLLHAADLLRRLRRFAEAEQAYAQALALDPDNAHAHLGMSRAALQRRDYAGAAEAALECLQRFYHHPIAHFLLGRALMGAKDYVRAAEAFGMALKINPNFPQAHLQLAWLRRHPLNDPAGAEEHLRLRREMQDWRQQRIVLDRPGNVAAAPSGERAMPSAPAAGVTEEVTLPALGEEVVIVSGLPRAGTSMVMQMLAAGGMAMLTDGQRGADEDNPLGYFEYEPVKQLFRNKDWLAGARGKVVKVVAPLVPALLRGVAYRVVFIERNLDEVLASQAKMIARQGPGAESAAAGKDIAAERHERLKEEYARVVERTKDHLGRQPGVRVLMLQHAQVLSDPLTTARRLNQFCGGGLRVEAMAAQVKPELRRQRGGEGR